MVLDGALAPHGCAAWWASTRVVATAHGPPDTNTFIDRQRGPSESEPIIIPKKNMEAPLFTKIGMKKGRERLALVPTFAIWFLWLLRSPALVRGLEQ